MTITVQPIGGTAVTVSPQDGATVADALNASGLVWEGQGILLNGASCTNTGTLVRGGDRISLIPQPKGA